MEEDWQMIFSTDKPYQADIILELLDENGIKGVIMNKKDSSYSSFGATEVYVKKDDEEKSIKIVKSANL